MHAGITLTGIDERTNVAGASALDAEIGILYSANPEGRNRYPSYAWIEEAVRVLPSVALHVCGAEAQQQLFDGQLGSVVAHVGRVQVNGAVHCRDIEALCNRLPGLGIITQHNEGNEALLKVRARNHRLLVDASGGQGIRPESWCLPTEMKEVGFAGGLSPENLEHELKRIAQVAHSERFWWVDMESSLRIDDWFSVERAQAAITAFDRWFDSSFQKGGA